MTDRWFISYLVFFVKWNLNPTTRLTVGRVKPLPYLSYTEYVPMMPTWLYDFRVSPRSKFFYFLFLGNLIHLIQLRLGLWLRLRPGLDNLEWWVQTPLPGNKCYLSWCVLRDNYWVWLTKECDVSCVPDASGPRLRPLRLRVSEKKSLLVLFWLGANRSGSHINLLTELEQATFQSLAILKFLSLWEKKSFNK